MKKFGRSMALLALGILLSLVGTAGAVDYHYQALGQPETAGWSVHPLAINNAGQIVGYCDMGDYTYHAFIQDGTQFIDLQKQLPDATSSQATGINDSGVVTGVFLVDGECHGFLWENGVVSDLGAMGFLGVGSGGGLALSDNGVVVGGILPTGSGTLADSNAFLWTKNEGIQDLGSLEGQHGSMAYAAKVVPGGNYPNARPNKIPPGLQGLSRFPTKNSLLSLTWIVGTAIGMSTWFQYPHAFLWTQKGGMQDLGTLGDKNNYEYDASWAYALNCRGQIVGSSSLGHYGPPGPYETHAFLWTRKGGMQDLGLLPDNHPIRLGSEARGINDLSQIVGFSGYTENNLDVFHATLWENGALRDLNDLVANKGDIPPGAVLGKAYGINNAGQIIGTTETERNPGNDYYGFVLTPQP
jgi:probable HAF family extracellular repeat protein